MDAIGHITVLITFVGTCSLCVLSLTFGRHIASAHLGAKPYKCPEVNCSSAFSEKSHLTRHIKLHSVPHPYKCTWPDCLAAFAKKNQLARHRCQHTNQLPYSCEICQQRFRYPSLVKKHVVRIHLREKRHVCEAENCCAAFFTFAELMKHRKSEHPPPTEVLKSNLSTVLICSFLAVNVIEFAKVRDI